MWKLTALAMALALVTAASLQAQCVISPPFTNNTSTFGQVELNCEAAPDGTSNSLFTPTAQDNVATTSPGGAVSFTMSNPAGSAGNPLSLYYSPGAPGAPLNIGIGELYLNLLAIETVVEGAGLFGPPTPFAAHPGPQSLYALFAGTPADPTLNGTCLTFQGLILDATAAGGLRLSNAIALQIRASVLSIAPNFGPPGTSVSLVTSGTGNGTAHFAAWNVNTDPSRPTVVSAVASGGTPTLATVPVGAGSGPIQWEENVTPGLLSFGEPDELNAFFCATDPVLGVQSLLPAGNLPLSADPVDPGRLNATATQILASGTTTDTWFVSLNEGDICEVEVFSLDATQTAILPGFGTAFSPGGSGFDPVVTIEQGSNGLPLTYDTGGVGPFAIHGDDDSGPGFNARAVFQALTTDTFNLNVTASVPGTFVSGDYLLNVRVITGQPAVRGFSIGGQNPANVGGFGETVSVLGPNIQAGGVYDVRLVPNHGFYAPVVVSGAVALLPGQVDFQLPPQAIGSFDIGTHRVQLVDVTGTTGTSLLWNDRFFDQPFGPLPDALCVTSAFQATAGNVPITASVSQLITPAVGPFGFTNVTNDSNGNAITAGQNIYLEVVGLDPATNNRLMDGVGDESTGGTQGVFNPIATLFGPGLIPQVAHDDDNGLSPIAYPWPNSGSAGIGQGSAFLTTLPFGGGTYTMFYRETICWVSCAQTKTGIINFLIY